MLDYAKRDEKIARKLEEIRNAPPEFVEKVTTKALKALFNLGVEQSRKELEWCENCEGRGYRPHTGVKFGFHSNPPLEYKMRKFCYCARGEELKRIYGVLGDWG